MRALKPAISFLCLAVGLMLVLSGQPRSQAAEAAGDGPEPVRVRVAVCQTLCIDSDKPGNLRRIAYAIEDAAAQGAQIACFPETVVLGWINPEAHELADPIPGPTTDRLAELARQHGIMISIGLCEKDGEKLYDSAVLISEQGELLLVYRKNNCLAGLMDPPYTRGDASEIRVVPTRYGRLGMLICADTFVDDLVDTVGRQRPDLVLIPYGWAQSGDAWPDHGKSLHHRVSVTAERLGCPVVGTNLVGAVSSGPWRGAIYGGQSVAADGRGQVLGVLRDRDTQVRCFDLTLEPRRPASDPKH